MSLRAPLAAILLLHGLAPAASPAQVPTRTETEKLLPSDVDPVVSFGAAVSQSGPRLAAGAGSADPLGILSAGAVYVYVRSGDRWLLEQRLVASDPEPIDLLGSAVDLDGATLVAGAQNDDDLGDGSGSAYVFVRSGGAWSQQQKLTASDGAAGDVFGRAVAVSGDLLAVGAPFEDEAGMSSGAVYVFSRVGTSWFEIVKVTASDAAASAFFGESIALDGSVLVVGSNAGAYVYELGLPGPPETVLLPGVPSVEGFGRPVAIGGDTVVVGAPGDDTGSPPIGSAGTAHVFVRSGDAWPWEVTFSAGSDAGPANQFGDALATDGDTVVVGTRLDDTVEANAGAAYVFERDDAIGWNLVEKLVPSDGAGGDPFGRWFADAVSVEGNAVAVGARRDDEAGSNAGAVYSFVPEPGLALLHASALLACAGLAARRSRRPRR